MNNENRLPRQRTATCCPGSTLSRSRSTGPPAARVEASGFIWSISGIVDAATPATPTVAVTENPDASIIHSTRQSMCRLD